MIIRANMQEIVGMQFKRKTTWKLQWINITHFNNTFLLFITMFSMCHMKQLKPHTGLNSFCCFSTFYSSSVQYCIVSSLQQRSSCGHFINQQKAQNQSHRLVSSQAEGIIIIINMLTCLVPSRHS